MATATPYISFGGKCAEAMNFYKEQFGGELQLMIVKDTPAASQCPEGMQNDVMHSELNAGNFRIMATDMTGPEGLKPGNNMSVAVGPDSEEQTHDWFNKLSEGGMVIDALKEQFWGGLFGVVIDKFGVCGMFNYTKNPM